MKWRVVKPAWNETKSDLFTQEGQFESKEASVNWWIISDTPFLWSTRTLHILFPIQGDSYIRIVHYSMDS